MGFFNFSSEALSLENLKVGAIDFAKGVFFTLVLRPSFTLGGAFSGPLGASGARLGFFFVSRTSAIYGEFLSNDVVFFRLNCKKTFSTTLWIDPIVLCWNFLQIRFRSFFWGLVEGRITRLLV